MEQTTTTPVLHDDDGCETAGDDEPEPRSIQVISSAGEDVDVDWIGDRLEAAAAWLGVEGIDLSVIVIDDAAMADLHERYSGIAGTTDVLTFDLRDAEAPGMASGSASAEPVAGEVYVCRDEAGRQASRRGHAVQQELLLYAVHGLLHLVGYDDHEPDDHARMHAKEDELLTAIGVGVTFAGGGASDADEDEA